MNNIEFRKELSTLISSVCASTMNFKGILGNLPWFNMNSSKDLGTSPKPATAVISMGSMIEQPKQKPCFDINFWGWSPFTIVPWAWAINAKDKIRAPKTTINRKLKRHARSGGVVDIGSGRGNPLRFRPYVSKVPWHTGARAFLSQFFPRYGHYCGPNWSSGKDNGSPLWDRRPIDWLDYCCYCHDIGYDTHDQAELLKADLAFLKCLERPNMATRGDALTAHVYKTMCITGLKNILVPYRTNLVKLQSGQPLINLGWLSNVKWQLWNFQKA